MAPLPALSVFVKKHHSFGWVDKMMYNYLTVSVVINMFCAYVKISLICYTKYFFLPRIYVASSSCGKSLVISSFQFFSMVWAIDNKHGQFLFARDEGINKKSPLPFLSTYFGNWKFRLVLSMEINSLSKQSSYFY